MEREKLSFFRKVKTSIIDFDGYQDLAAEKISRTILYIILLILAFSIIISATYTFQFTKMLDNVKSYINNEISEIKYENYELSILTNDGSEISEIDVDDIINAKIIINTQTTDENKIQESIDEIKTQKNGILILKDKLIIKNEFSSKLLEYSYKSISEQYNINKIDKNEIINLLSGQQMINFMIMLFGTIFIYMFIMYLSNILIDILLFAVLAYIVTRFAGLRLKYSAIYNIASYSLTLPLILNMIYFVVNSLTGFTIEYFRIMYNGVASIYIITSILMIKSDVIKKQMELNKIIEEQEKVKEELRRKEEERKAREEQERREKEREKKKEEDKKKEEGEIDKEPEGDNA